MKYREIRTLEQLKAHFSLTRAEEAFWEKGSTETLPLALNSYWAALCGNDPESPLRRQALPRVEELETRDYETSDPLGDLSYSPVPRLTHRYKDRVLLLVTQQCALYCRHCFRRHFTGRDKDEISFKEIDAALEYVAADHHIHEILLSGGDALLLSEPKLFYFLEKYAALKKPMLLRIGTRLPLTAPYKFPLQWLDRLSKVPGLWLLIQCNHPDELTPEASAILKQIRLKGIPMLNQSVLLKGVNDKVETLKNLSYRLLEQGVKPYYIFQGDLASGTAHFRVPLDRCFQLMEELRSSVSGMAMPRFAVDLPGGGKIPLSEKRLLGKDEHYYYFKNLEGKSCSYPREDE